MQPDKPKNLNDHLANERTFLAWLRTGIGVMAFGFVVVKFSLFFETIFTDIWKPKHYSQQKLFGRNWDFTGRFWTYNFHFWILPL